MIKHQKAVCEFKRSRLIDMRKVAIAASFTLRLMRKSYGCAETGVLEMPYLSPGKVTDKVID